MKRAGFAASLLVVATAGTQPWNEAFAACNSTVNGRPMSNEVCALATRVYGSVTPGHYWLDQQGNWGYLGSPNPAGNLYRDAQRGNSRYGSTYSGDSFLGRDGDCYYYSDHSGRSWSNC